MNAPILNDNQQYKIECKKHPFCGFESLEDAAANNMYPTICPLPEVKTADGKKLSFSHYDENENGTITHFYKIDCPYY